MEYVYPLNFPHLRDVFIKEELDKLFLSLRGQKNGYTHADILVRPEWRNILGFQMTRIFVFIKHDKMGGVHIDELTYKPGDTFPLFWGINWIWGGDSIMEYWDRSKIITVDPIIIHGQTYNGCTVEGEPTKKYRMNEGGVYLVNGSNPHRAAGIGDRWVFSVRPEYGDLQPWQRMDWEGLVKHFGKNIIAQ